MRHPKGFPWRQNYLFSFFCKLGFKVYPDIKLLGSKHLHTCCLFDFIKASTYPPSLLKQATPVLFIQGVQSMSPRFGLHGKGFNYVCHYITPLNLNPPISPFLGRTSQCRGLHRMCPLTDF